MLFKCCVLWGGDSPSYLLDQKITRSVIIGNHDADACFPRGTRAAFVGLVSGEGDEEEEMDQ